MIFTLRFEDELAEILSFIGEFSPQNAANFKHEIYAKIKTLNFMPFRCRRHGKDKDVRDFVFKGFVVVFRVVENEVRILGIYKDLEAKNE